MDKKIRKIISNYKNKRFETIELEKEMKKSCYDKSIIFEYIEFAKAINLLVDEEKIKPVLASKMNNMQPSLYKKYMKVDRMIEVVPASELIGYHPKMKMASFKTDRKRYEKVKPYIKKISDFLFHPDKEIITINERSLELFDNEKSLDSENGRKLLSLIGLTLDDLYCEKTYEPFFYYEMRVDKVENVLIVENKDTFHSFKKLMSQGINSWGGISFQFLIYGEGNKITKSIDYVDEVGIPEEVNIYYFGDIDKEGVSIKGRLDKQTDRTIKWMDHFYRICWEEGRKRNIKIRNKQRLNNVATKDFALVFDSVDQNEVFTFIENNFFIPQEILNQRKLRRLANNVRP